jgi:hypothetical protein
VLKVLEIVLIVLTPTLAGAALVGGLNLWRDGRRRLRIRRQGGAAARPPIEVVAADLRRLHREVTRTEDARQAGPGRQTRLIALRSAYCDALRVACQSLEVPVPEADLTKASAARILALEAALRERGLDVYPVARR